MYSQTVRIFTQNTPCPGKKGLQSFVNNFKKFKRISTVFGRRYPDVAFTKNI